VSFPALIGLTAGNDPAHPDLYVLRWDYVRSIELNGGIPVVLAPSGAALHPALFSRLDGLVLTGGVDVEPALYGRAPHATVTRTSAERDEFELGLVRRALAADLPVLAICRGLQVLNVALGGTLVQDLPSTIGTAVSHDDKARPRTGIAHDVSILPGSRLHALLGIDEAAVNSFHHQAVAALGHGLVPAAFSADGVVEAVELPGARFVLGVQWHPEAFWREPQRFGALFRELIRAAEEWMAAAPVPVATS
jgi:putative glutamine amidotransferase